jgi:sugar-specific transcriptional regulator TrmB
MLANLKEVGMSENEARVYLAMLELGPATVLEIASEAHINRPTAYVQIDSLKKMGLAATKKKNRKVLFIAGSPEKLNFLLNKQRAELETRREELNSVMPGLMAAFDLAEEKPVIRYFEGNEGLAKVRLEALRCKEKIIRSISSIEVIVSSTPNAVSKYPTERIKKGIYSKIIYTSRKGAILKKTDKEYLRESKFISPKDLTIKFDFSVFDDKVILGIPYGKTGSIIIQNKNIAESFKSLFDFVWNSIPN